jgi:hypothetical protein
MSQDGGFEVVETLPWPPEIRTRMHIAKGNNNTWLKISLANMERDAIKFNNVDGWLNEGSALFHYLVKLPLPHIVF